MKRLHLLMILLVITMPSGASRANMATPFESLAARAPVVIAAKYEIQGDRSLGTARPVLIPTRVYRGDVSVNEIPLTIAFEGGRDYIVLLTAELELYTGRSACGSVNVLESTLR